MIFCSVKFVVLIESLLYNRLIKNKFKHVYKNNQINGQHIHNNIIFFKTQK